MSPRSFEAVPSHLVPQGMDWDLFQPCDFAVTVHPRPVGRMNVNWNTTKFSRIAYGFAAMIVLLVVAFWMTSACLA